MPANKKAPKDKKAPRATKSIKPTKAIKPAKKPTEYHESVLQAAIIQVFSLLGVYAMQIPNGEISGMTVRKYQRLVAMGFRAGAPDLIIFQRGENRFFGMELKRPKSVGVPAGKLSAAQITFQDLCLQNNWPYAIIDSVDGAVEQAKEWGLVIGRSPMINAKGPTK